MRKILVVVYSHTGASRRLAELLASLQQWTLAEVRDVQPRAGSAGTWRCFLDSLLQRRPKIRYDGPNPRSFDAVVLVSPIWVGRLAGPMRSFVAEHRASLREVVVVSVMGERGAANAVAEVSRLIVRAPIFDAAFKTREIEDGSFAARLQAFGKAIAESKESTPAVRPTELSPRAA